MEECKHLLILGHVPLSEDHPNFGNVARHPGRWVYDQAKALSDHTSHRVTLVTLVKGASRDVEIKEGKLRIIYLRAQPRARVWSLFIWDIIRVRKLIRKEKPDLVHAHGIEDAYALSIYNLNIPKVLTLQSLYEDYNAKNAVQWYSAPRLIESLEKKALKGFNSAIVKSAQFGEVVKKYHPGIVCDIIPNTLSDVFLKVQAESKLVNKVAFVGTVCPRKGFHLIREALSRLDPSTCPVELHVFGDGGNLEYVTEQLKGVEATGHRMINHGSVTADKLASGLATSNLLLAPSYGETFGNQVIEGLLCRCHCVVTEETGMAENIRKYGHGTIIPQKDSAAIVLALEKLLEIGLSTEEMKQRGLARKLLLEELGPAEIAQKLSAHYQKVLVQG